MNEISPNIPELFTDKCQTTIKCLTTTVLSDNEHVWTVEGTQQVSYQIAVVDDIFDTKNDALKNLIQSPQEVSQLIVIDEMVAKLFGEKISAYFDHHSIDFTMHKIEVGEEVKNLETSIKIVEMLEANGTLRRSTPFIAVGGGVLLDLAGFAASLFRRGVPHIRIPTNLMGLIDASLGVKTGINVGDRRNRLGTYSAPATVLLDKTFLTTVSPRDISNGLAEILKMGVIKDKKTLSASGSWRHKAVGAPDAGRRVCARSYFSQLSGNARGTGTKPLGAQTRTLRGFRAFFQPDGRNAGSSRSAARRSSCDGYSIELHNFCRSWLVEPARGRADCKNNDFIGPRTGASEIRRFRYIVGFAW